MGAIFSKPKTPEIKAPEEPPPPPERSGDETAALAETQRRKRAIGGRSLTSLTGGQGAASGSAVMRYLGGAART